ncbi:hypothetical protein [Nonomuraea phyllanthi]|nr:hypothetical protein [Nonomuraea phyllanthi]
MSAQTDIPERIATSGEGSEPASPAEDEHGRHGTLSLPLSRLSREERR